MILLKCWTQYASNFGIFSSGHRTRKSFHSNPKERQCQRMFKLPHNCTHLTRQQSNAKNFPSKPSGVHELRISRCSGWIQKRQRNQRSNCQHPLDHRGGKRVPEKLLLLFIDYLKPLTVWITTNCGKFFKRLKYQTTLPAS